MKKGIKKFSIRLVILIFSICIGSRTALAIHQENEVKENIEQLEELEAQVNQEEMEKETSQLATLMPLNTSVATTGVNILGNANWATFLAGGSAVAGEALAIGSLIASSPAFPFIIAAFVVTAIGVIVYNNNDQFQAAVNSAVVKVATALSADNVMLKELSATVATSLNTNSQAIQLSSSQIEWTTQQMADVAFLENELTLDMDYSKYNAMLSSGAYFFYGKKAGLIPLYGYDYKRGIVYNVDQVMVSTTLYSNPMTVINFIDEQGKAIPRPEGTNIYYNWYRHSAIASGSFRQTVIPDLPTARQKALGFINGNSPYQLGFNATKSAAELTEEMQVNRSSMQTKVQKQLVENTLDLPIDGLTATLNDQAVVLNPAGQLIYQATGELVPQAEWLNIHWGYEQGLALSAGELILGGRPAEVDENTGQIVDKRTKQLIPSKILNAAGLIAFAWSQADTKNLVEQLESNAADFEKDKLYTLTDLYMDEMNGGHTIAKHVGKSDAYLQARLDLTGTGIRESTSYENVFQALLGINLSYFQNGKQAGGGDYGRLPLYKFGYGFYYMNFNNQMDVYNQVITSFERENYGKRNYKVKTSYPKLTSAS